MEHIDNCSSAGLQGKCTCVCVQAIFVMDVILRCYRRAQSVVLSLFCQKAALRRKNFTR